MSYQVFTSEKISIAQEILMDIAPDYAHCFAGIRYYDAGGTQVAPTNGVTELQAKHLTNNNFDTVINSVLQATNPGSESEWGGNVTQVKATAKNITGTNVATYQLVVVQNLS